MKQEVLETFLNALDLDRCRMLFYGKWETEVLDQEELSTWMVVRLRILGGYP